MSFFATIVLFCFADLCKLLWKKYHVPKVIFLPQERARILAYFLVICFFFTPVDYTSNFKVTSVSSLNVEEDPAACLLMDQTLDQYWFVRDFIHRPFKFDDYPSSTTYTIILNRETPSLKKQLFRIADKTKWILVTPQYTRAELRLYEQSYHLLGDSSTLYDSIRNIVETAKEGDRGTVLSS